MTETRTIIQGAACACPECGWDDNGKLEVTVEDFGGLRNGIYVIAQDDAELGWLHECAKCEHDTDDIAAWMKP